MKAKRIFTGAVAAAALLAPAALTAVSPVVFPSATVQAASSINDLISQNGYQPAKIETYQSTFTQYTGYRHGVGMPEGVVVHDTANDSSTIDNEITYMQREWNKTTWSYVHGFVDANRIINIAPTDYSVWGAGGIANARFMQIELVHAHSRNDFAKSVLNDAYYTAYLLKQYGLPVDDASDGSGTVWSHAQVTKYLGGTDHTDPDGYFARYGYSMSQFVQLVQREYAAIGGAVQPDTAPDTALEQPKSFQNANRNVTVSGNNVNGVYSLTDAGFKAFGLSRDYDGQSFTVTKTATTASGLNFSLLTQNGKEIGWIQTSALKDVAVKTPAQTVVSQVKLSKQVTASGAAAYYLLSKGFSAFSTATGTFTVTKQATMGDGAVYYLVNKGNTKGWGWLKASDTKDYAAPTPDKPEKPAQPVQQPAKLTVTVKAAQPLYYLLSKGFKQFATTDKYATKQYQVTKKAAFSGQDYYLLKGSNGKAFAWIKASSVTVGTTIPQTPQTPQPDTSGKQKISGVVKIHYVPGYGIAVWQAPGKNYTKRKLKHGTSWRVYAKQVVNGRTWYNLGGNQWIDSRYAQLK